MHISNHHHCTVSESEAKTTKVNLCAPALPHLPTNTTLTENPTSLIYSKSTVLIKNTLMKQSVILLNLKLLSSKSRGKFQNKVKFILVFTVGKYHKVFPIYMYLMLLLVIM